MATRMTAKLQQQLLERNRQKDQELVDNEKRVKSDNTWTANVESEWRVDNKRYIKARQQMDNEQDMHDSLLYAERDRGLRQQQTQQEEKLCEELGRRKTEQLRDEKTRQRIRNDSQEIRDLEAKLKAAYTNKERFAQMAEKAAVREEERKKDEELALKQKKYNEWQEENDRVRRVARYKENVRYQQELEKQLEDQERLKQDAYRESLKDKLMVDEIVRKIYEEDRQAAEREMEKQKTTKKYIDDFKAAREAWKRQEKATLEEENRQLKAYAKLQDEREARLRQQKQQNEGRMAEAHRMLSEQLHKQAEEKAELEQAGLELAQEEQEARHRHLLNTQAQREQQAKQELRRAHEEYLHLRDRRLQEQEEEERRFKQEVLAKLAEDDRLEQLSAQQRRLKQQQHQRALHRLMEERRAQFAAEREEEAREREEEMKQESHRLAVVAEERQRLLHEHASRLLGYLPKGVIEGEGDLDLLGDQFRQAYRSRQLDPFVLHEQLE